MKTENEKRERGEIPQTNPERAEVYEVGTSDVIGPTPESFENAARKNSQALAELTSTGRG
jgi:hypothetical protein